MTDNEFLNRALELHYLTPGHVKEVMKAQAQIHAVGLELSAVEVCLKRKLLTAEQAKEVIGPDPQADRPRFGPYSVTAKLGEGGMGSVYKAVREGSDAVYALKILPRKFTNDEELVARFKREAKLSCTLRHPNIVQGIDYGLVRGRYYYAMEHVDGVLLADVIEQQGLVKERATLQIAIQMADALVEIARRGLVHRDIKPDNVIIDNEGTAKLMDLGLIKSVVMNITTLTRTGFTLGTPQYMSYEQIMGKKDLDIRADIYSLGASLYHMVTGAAPFEGVPVMELLQKFLKLKLTDPRSRQALSDGFCVVLSRMLAKKREDRYANPELLLEDLRLAHDGQTPKTRSIEVMAPPPKKQP